MSRYDLTHFEWRVIEPLLHAQYPAQEQLALENVLQQSAVSRAEPDRAVLLQAQAFPPRRHPLRQARRQLPRHDPVRLYAAMASRLWVYGVSVPPRVSSNQLAHCVIRPAREMAVSKLRQGIPDLRRCVAQSNTARLSL